MVGGRLVGGYPRRCDPFVRQVVPPCTDGLSSPRSFRTRIVSIAQVLTRRPIQIVLVLLLFAAGGAILRVSGIGRQAPVPLTLYGNVDVRQVNLGFRVPGRVADLSVDEGDRVDSGAVLAPRGSPQGGGSRYANGGTGTKAGPDRSAG